MDQVSSSPFALTRTTAAPPSRGVDAYASAADASAADAYAAETAADPGKDPYSPVLPLPATSDPLAESIGAMLGALLALLTLVVPLLGVLSDRRAEPSSSIAPERSVRVSASGGLPRR
ncbi:MAG: hypothetical protein ACKO6F_05745 [Cyanobium sp.]